VEELRVRMCVRRGREAVDDGQGNHIHGGALLWPVAGTGRIGDGAAHVVVPRHQP